MKSPSYPNGILVTLISILLLSLPLPGAVDILPTPSLVQLGDGWCPVEAARTPVIQAADKDLGPEGYQLEITSGGAVIRASAPAGEFYARQSLEQLVALSEDGRIPCVRIEDRPKYAWRSFMIDSGRQYQQLDTIKGLLDRMAMLKLNVFHWHLSENDGWRIEIKQYPELTRTGAFVANGPEQHGFYTQAEVREIVAYAAERHITVVPEVDIPGHANAALTAYPENTCTGQPPAPRKKGHSPYIFCGGKESTYVFLNNVLDELCQLFPSEYIHIGGDEAPKAEWKKCAHCQDRIEELGLRNEHELQIHMTNRLARHLATHGRKAVCWGDVVTKPGQELEDNIVVHWWNWRRHKYAGLRGAVERGMPVIANPNYYTYLNFPQKHPWRKYGTDRVFDLKMAYEENRADLRNPTEAEKQLVLGMGCCLWTDHGLTEEWLDRRLFPRLFAMAEQMWSTAERMPYETFRERVYARQPLLEEKGIGGDWKEEF
jgi:N-acetyl-beta-hexosaminidase